jgi:hypothetical protein
MNKKNASPEHDGIEEEIEENINYHEPEQFVTQSNPGGIGASQSLGVDPSVDSLAIEEYDHVEYVN